MPVVFITDALIFLLVFMVICFIFYARRHEHLRAPWRQVVTRPMAMSSAVILVAYILVGLLDSVHFHPKLPDSGAGQTIYSTEIRSLLDVVVMPLRVRNEKTYSAPLASRLYAKETIELPDGSQIRDFPRLLHGGAHLHDPESEKNQDITMCVLIGLILGIIFSGLFAGFFVLISSRANKVSFTAEASAIIFRRKEIPWHAILLTLSLLVVTVTITIILASKYYVLGTDKVGQDVLYQSLKSIRTGLVIGTLTTLVMLPFAIMMGLMAGYFRGWIDDVIQYLYTTLNSIPGVLLIAAAILILQVYIANHADEFTSLEHRADMRLLFLCIILGITSWTGLCRMLRGETLKLREIDYVQAAQAFGVGNMTIMLRHLLPNVMHIVMISIVLDFSGLVLAEAVLSYINIGVDPTMHSWGNMINSARLEMAREPIVWWSLASAFLFMFVLVLAANLFSDAVRDAFDPRIRTNQD
jgi:peptide/nickel transport system permease protein